MGVRIEKGGTRFTFGLTFLEMIVVARVIRRDKKTLRQLISDGIELYEIYNHKSIRLFRERLLKRLNEKYGISRAMIVELRVLYTLIGHYLQKIEDK